MIASPTNTWYTVPWDGSSPTRTGAYQNRRSPYFGWGNSLGAQGLSESPVPQGALNSVLESSYSQSESGGDGLNSATPSPSVGPASPTAGKAIGAVADITSQMAGATPLGGKTVGSLLSSLAQDKGLEDIGWSLAKDLATFGLNQAIPGFGIALSLGLPLANWAVDELGLAGPSTGLDGRTTESVESVGSKGYQSGVLGMLGFGDISFNPTTMEQAMAQMDAQAAENDRQGFGGFTGGYEGLTTETSYGDLGGGGSSTSSNGTGQTGESGSGTTGSGSGTGAGGGVGDGLGGDGVKRGGLIKPRGALNRMKKRC